MTPAPTRIQAPPLKIRFFDKEAISEHLHCPICQEVFSYPYALLCGHVFCKGCIDEWLRHQHTCPECRERVDMRLAHKDLTAHKFLDSLQVYCSYLGCSWIGRMDALQSHCSDCEYNPAKLPDYMVTKEVSEPGEEAAEGTTSLRMKLFKGEMRGLLDQAASGDMNIFSSSASRAQERRIPPNLSDLTSDLVSSADVINRNRREENFINISDDDSS